MKRVVMVLSLLATPSCGGGASPTDASTAADLSFVTMAHNTTPVVCAGTTCTVPTNVCCSSDDGATGTCGGTYGDYCGESGTPWTDCTSDSVCPNGGHCCGHSYGSTMAFRCTVVGACVGGDVNGCQIPADCVLGQMCCKYHASGPSFGHCATSCP